MLRVDSSSSLTREHPVGEPLRNGTELRGGQVTALGHQGSQEAKGEQRVASRSLGEPLDERLGWGTADHAFGQGGGAGETERVERHPCEHLVLLQPEKHLRGHLLLAELRRAAHGDNENRCFGNVVGEVAKRVPGGGVSPMDIIEDDNNRLAPSQIADHHGQRLEQG